MIKLASDTIDQKDIDSLVKWLQQKPIPQLTKGPLTIEYEKQYSELIGRKYAVFVNSGSSANLLAIDALIQTGRLKNKKIVVPALSWITTISPVCQLGLTPILCDINLKDLSVCPQHLEKIFIEQNPAALFLVSILGLVPDMDKIECLCDKYGIILIHDACESQCSSLEGYSIESFGLISTCSSYFGHFSSTIEGGMITTDDYELYNTLKRLRSHGWSRDNCDDEKNRLRRKYDISGFNSLYTFYSTGYNVRSTDLQAFIGLEQLKKQKDTSLKRNANYLLYNKLLKNDYWKPQSTRNSFVCNLGYPVIHPNRDKIVAELIKNGVEVRPLISGSMGKQPFWIDRYGMEVLHNVTIVDDFGFYCPNNPSITKEDIQFICDIINPLL